MFRTCRRFFSVGSSGLNAAGRQPTPRTFSGIQPTGNIHLGNYLGAVKSWSLGLKSQENINKDENIFSVVDLHAITLPQKREDLRINIVEMFASLVSCGVDPDKCILFQQSGVGGEHAELAWILGTLCTVPQLSRLSQYKDKSKNLKEVSLGLFIYPVLQSADILLYKSSKVPVGQDNLQNVETARDIQKAFNRTFKKEFFPKPEPILSPASRIQSLRTPENKMSKSDPDPKSCIYINDSPDTLRSKLKKSVTDSMSHVSYEPEARPGVSNLIRIHAALTDQTTDQVVESVQHLNTGQYKLHLADITIEHLTPIREKYEYLIKNEDELSRIIQQGNDSAREIATETITQVKKLVGFT